MNELLFCFGGFSVKNVWLPVREGKLIFGVRKMGNFFFVEGFLHWTVFVRVENLKMSSRWLCWGMWKAMSFILELEAFGSVEKCRRSKTVKIGGIIILITFLGAEQHNERNSVGLVKNMLEE